MVPPGQQQEVEEEGPCEQEQKAEGAGSVHVSTVVETILHGHQHSIH